MNLILEFCIVFLICMAGEWIAAFLPFTLPASVISLLLLLILLLCGGVKERTIQGTSQFLIGNMGLFFIPAHRGDAGISGCAEAAGHPLSGGDAGVHAGGLRGDRVEHPGSL